MYIHIIIYHTNIYTLIKFAREKPFNLQELSDKKQGPHKFLFLLQWSQHHKGFPPLLCHDF